jgi:exosortase
MSTITHNQSLKDRKAKIIILAGNRDFGRCPLASRRPPALWPVAGEPALQRLLTSLANQGIKQVTICANADNLLLQKSIHIDNRLQVEFLDEPLPVGSAGCIRDAAANQTDALLVALPAAITCPPKIDLLLQAHYAGGCDLTVMLNPNDSDTEAQLSGIYVCNPAILQHIPKEGYFDIKEGLIPQLLLSGKSVHTAPLPHHAGNFRNWQQYLNAVCNYIENTPKPDPDLKPSRQPNQQNVWTASTAKIDKDARIYGSAIILDNANISDGAVIIGPTILESNVTIGPSSAVVNSVVWNGAKVGPNCQIRQCVIDCHAVVQPDTIVTEKPIPFKQPGIPKNLSIRTSQTITNSTITLHERLRPYIDKIEEKLPDWEPANKRTIVSLFAGTLVFIAFLWSYWPGLADLWRIWQRSDEYSSGLLVPFLAVYILCSRRHDIAQCNIRPCVWGLFAFIAAQAFRLFGLIFMYGSAERLSIALTIAALVLLLFGWQLFRKVATIILFLCLMLPWPTRVQAAVTLPFQRWATSSAVFCLEMMGFEVVQEGNIIHIGQASVAVAEACNGLRMVTAFFVIGGLVVLLVKRTWWEKLLIFASSLPIALLCNTIRLTITALAFTVISGEYWEKIFHDFGGYAMMPLALAATVGELWLLTKLTTISEKQQAIIITRQNR